MSKKIILLLLYVLFNTLLCAREINFDSMTIKLGKNISEITKGYATECVENHPTACMMLSALLIQSTKNNQDMGKAAQAYLKACENGEALGCTMLGRMYADGNGIEQNGSKAVEFYVKGCEGKETIGCMMGGIMYAEGKKIERNYPKSLDLLEKSCDYGAMIGCTSLGAMYLKARGISKAVNLFYKACDANESLGCTTLSYMYKNGLGTQRDIAISEQLLAKADAICKTIGNREMECTQQGKEIIEKGIIEYKNRLDEEKILRMKAIYAEKYDQLSEEEKKYIFDNFDLMRHISQDILNRYGQGRIPKSVNINDNNLIEFYLYPDGSISDFRFIKKSKVALLDDVTKEVIELSYAKYTRPEQKTLIRYRVNYNLGNNSKP